jgi:CHAT domain-containing protein
MAGIYDDLGEKEKALDYLKQALLLRHAGKNRKGEAATLNNLGRIYDELDEKQQALDYLRQAASLFHAIGDRAGEARAVSNIGLVYKALGRSQSALDHYTQALPLFRAVEDRWGEANTLMSIGAVYEDLVERQRAFDYYGQALPLFRDIGDRGGEANALGLLAHVERDRGNLREALVRIEAAIDIIESLRTKLASQELRASYFSTVQGYYELYIDVLMHMHKQQPSAGYDGKALEASERGRARSLLELLAEAGADIRQGVDPKLVEREHSLQNQLNARAQQQRQLLSSQYTAEQAKAIAKEIESLTTERQQIEAQIRQTSPRYAALTQPRPLTLREIQTQVLDANTLLLEYSLGPDHSYLWAVTSTSITSYELPRGEEIEAAAKQFYEMLNTPTSIYAGADQKKALGLAVIDAQQQEMVKTAARLSQMLVGPVAEQLGQKRLVIVPDASLQYLPFAALPDPVLSKQAAKSMQPLIVQHEIVSLPSISMVMTLRKEIAGRKPAPKELAVLADPVFYSDDERVKRNPGQKNSNQQKASSVEDADLTALVERVARETRARRDGDRLARLKGTRKEAEGILALVPPDKAKLALDFDASRALASRGELSQYRYVHFATHGLLDSGHPELSAIVLSLVDENGKPQDGYLRAHEIYNLNLPADMVVLSGCQTGLGKKVRGEGLVGLARGFMYAGAARVVMSLWSVDDEATAKLMVIFYRGMIKEGRRPAEALRAAQIEMLKQPHWQAPNYWAAFVLQGDWR